MDDDTAPARDAVGAVLAASLDEILRALLVDELELDPDRAATATPTAAAGVIDSVAICHMAALIEKRLGVSVPDTELVAANFSSLDAMTALVERLTSRR